MNRGLSGGVVVPSREGDDIINNAGCFRAEPRVRLGSCDE